MITLNRPALVTQSSCRYPCRQIVYCASKRKPKNAEDFGKDYDAIRASLEAEGGWEARFSFSTMLRNISQSTFGSKGRGLYRTVLDFGNTFVPRRAPELLDISEYTDEELAELKRFWCKQGMTVSDAEKLVRPVVRVSRAWADLCSPREATWAW